MRVTQSQINRNFLFDLENFNENLAKISRQVSSGKKLTQLVDSPKGSADLVSLTEMASKIDMYRSNLDAGSFFLATADSALNEVNNLVTSIYTKGSQAASETISQDARATMAMEVRSLRDQIFSLANSQARGRYIFGGSTVLSPPFVINGDTVVYQGDADVNGIPVNDGLEVAQGVAGSDAFNSVFSAINSLLTALDGNDIPGIAAALGQFSSVFSGLGQVRGQIGANLSLLQNVKMNLESRETSLVEQRSQVEDADMAKAVVQLNQTQTALQAAMSAGGAIISQRNLFDILG
jgi:flagellar hook-associated protein 3 FlgL